MLIEHPTQRLTGGGFCRNFNCGNPARVARARPQDYPKFGLDLPPCESSCERLGFAYRLHFITPNLVVPTGRPLAHWPPNLDAIYRAPFLIQLIAT